MPWRREWLSTLVPLPGESYGQRILAGYSPWGSQRVKTWQLLNTYTHTRNLDRQWVAYPFAFFLLWFKGYPELTMPHMEWAGLTYLLLQLHLALCPLCYIHWPDFSSSKPWRFFLDWAFAHAEPSTQNAVPSLLSLLAASQSLDFNLKVTFLDFPYGWESTYQCRRQSCNPWSGKIPTCWEARKDRSTTSEAYTIEPVFCHKRSHQDEKS